MNNEWVKEEKRNFKKVFETKDNGNANTQTYGMQQKWL